MGFLFGRKTQSASMPAVSSMQLQNSAYGTVIPLVYGTTRIAPNLIDYIDFKAVQQRWQNQQPARVFPILFGEGNADEMRALAELTGGRTFDARKTALTQVFKEAGI